MPLTEETFERRARVGDQQPKDDKRQPAFSADEEQRLLKESIQEFDDWEITTRDARTKAERDRDYYDGKQWTAEQEATLEERGQAAVVKNRIFKKVNFLIGLEISNRSDPKALPVTQHHDDDSRAITDSLRFVTTHNEFNDVASDVWENVLIEGYGGCIETVDRRTKNIVIQHVAWDRLWFDVHSRKHDFSDARSLGLTVWMDYHDALADYGSRQDAVEDYASVLAAAVTQSSGTGDETHDDKPRWVTTDSKHRKRLRITERYFKQRDKRTGEVHWYFCAFTRSHFLIKPRPTGYTDHDGIHQCPLIMESCFVTREGERYGLVRHMIGAQDEINKRSSKYLHLISVRQLMMEHGAVENVQETTEQFSRPDGVIVVNDDAIKDGKIQVLTTNDMAQGNYQLLAEAKMEIDTIGPEIPQIGTVGSSASGRALMMRQQVGNLELAKPNRHHRSFKLRVYKQGWHNIRRVWTEEKWFRVTDDTERTGFRFVGLNRRTTRGKRFAELIQKEVPVESALNAVMGADADAMLQQATQIAVQQLQAQMQAQLQMQAQQAPRQPGQMQLPQPSQKDIEQMAAQVLLQDPRMAEPFTAADTARLKVDIELEESPDVAILQQEEFDNLATIMPTAVSTNPQLAPTMVELLIEASQLRSKKKLLQILRQPPDQQAMQMQQLIAQLQVALQQANVQKTQADASLSAARAQKEQVETQTVLPKAQSDIKLTEAKSASQVAGASKTIEDMAMSKLTQGPAVVVTNQGGNPYA